MLANPPYKPLSLGSWTPLIIVVLWFKRPKILTSSYSLNGLVVVLAFVGLDSPTLAATSQPHIFRTDAGLLGRICAHVYERDCWAAFLSTALSAVSHAAVGVMNLVPRFVSGVIMPARITSLHETTLSER